MENLVINILVIVAPFAVIIIFLIIFKDAILKKILKSKKVKIPGVIEIESRANQSIVLDDEKSTNLPKISSSDRRKTNVKTGKDNTFSGTFSGNAIGGDVILSNSKIQSSKKQRGNK